MQEINGRTKICGLIGNPVEHTLSPLIHNTLSRALGKNFVYVPFLVEDGNLKTAVKGAYALNVAGLNVTVPYKSEVISQVKEMDELAAHIGAVNTLVRCEGGYKGFNTDMTGLYRAMMSEGIVLSGEKVIVLGAGGAARAVVFMCVHFGAKAVYVLNRTRKKAEEVTEEANRTFRKNCVYALGLTEYEKLPEGKFLAIQSTSVGLFPNTEEAVIEEAGFYEKIHTGYDLVYSPFETKFMRLVKKQEGKAYNGLKMLLYQGVEAYEYFSKEAVSEALSLEVYEKMKKAMGADE